MFDNEYIYFRKMVGRSFFFTGILFLFIFLTSGCIFSSKDSTDNGNGAGKDGKPEILNIGISDGQVINSRDVIINWKGNEAAAFYQYTLDNTVSEINADSMAIITDLEEADHVFILKAFNESIIESSVPDTVNFTVNAIQGPGIVFSPRKITTEPSISITLADVSNLMAAHIVIFCENRCVLFGDFTLSDSLDTDGEIISIENTSASQLIIDIAFAGETEGLSGSIKLGSILVTPLRAGNIIVDPSTTVFRNINNENISIYDLDFVRVTQ